MVKADFGRCLLLYTSRGEKVIDVILILDIGSTVHTYVPQHTDLVRTNGSLWLIVVISWLVHFYVRTTAAYDAVLLLYK